MGMCFLYGNGGGNSLGYSVICQTAEPAKKEGRIWVKSSVPMTAVEWANDPWTSGAVGRVDIGGVPGGSNPTSANSTIMVFNVKRAGIWEKMKLTPTFCKQVQGSTGNWVYVDAYVCHSDTWVQFSRAWNGELFDNGDQWTIVTGGWVGNNQTEIGTTLKLKVANSRPIVSTVNAIDLSGYSTLHCIADLQLGKVGVASTKDLTAGEPAWTASTNIKAQEVTVDISSLTTGYIQLFAGASWTATVNATKVWLT